MKTIIFFFAMHASVFGFAQAIVTPVSVDYATKKVTFKVAWTTAANNRVWVWVDLCPVTGTSPSTFAKAEISEATGSGVVAGTLNGRGFYVNVNGATVTAKLDNATGKFNWCAYGSDFPPNARENGSSYTLKGSPPFKITTASSTIEWSAKTYTGGTITAITDATGCPGVLCGKNGEAAGLLNCCATGTTNCSGTCKTVCAVYSENCWDNWKWDGILCYGTEVCLTRAKALAESRNHKYYNAMCADYGGESPSGDACHIYTCP